jgi:hypothetical protein
MFLLSNRRPNMPNRRRRKNKPRYADAKTEYGLELQRAAAYRAIRALYRESLPLWPTCGRGFCRRNHTCGGEADACLSRAWPLTPPHVQKEARAMVERGGPRRLPPATHKESVMRSHGSSEFVG